MSVRDELVAGGLMDVREVCAFLSLSRRTVWRLMGEGKLPYVRLMSARRIPRNAVVQFAAENLVMRSVD